MKNILFLFIVLISPFHLSFGQISDEQYLLSEVNPHWKDISLTAGEALRVHQCKTWRDLIQLHLALVTDHLIKATASLSLEDDVKQKRLAALTYLTEYYKQGIFPLNTKNETPTPIFVDDAGTRCAVGQLLYKSGQEEIVTKISKESNLNYISQLDLQYADVGDWAEANGFTIDELAWIQPSYAPNCNPNLSAGQIVNVSCHGGYDGGFRPDLYQFGPEYSLFSLGDVFYFDSINWIDIVYSDCLQAGLYKQNLYGLNEVTNKFDSIIYYVEINEPDSITTTYQIKGDPQQCRASIDFIASGGSPPYETTLYNQNFISLVNADLCVGVYWLEVKDSHECFHYDSINLFSSINNPENQILVKIYPNPSNDFVQLHTNEDFPIDYSIYTSLGIKVSSGKLVSADDQINLTNLVNGVYYFVSENIQRQRRIFQKIIKTTF